MRSLAAFVPTRCVGVSLLALAACSEVALPDPGRPPVVAGLAVDGLPAHVRGRVLLDELACTACHDAGEGEEHDIRTGPNLAHVGSRIDPGYLEAFLANPRWYEAGTTMPDLLGSRSATERTDVARALAHYLRSLDSEEFERQPHDAAAYERGGEAFHSIGCVACHSPRDPNDAENVSASWVSLGWVASKYGADSLRAFLLAPHEVRPSGRMPDFGLSPQEAHDLSHYLVARGTNGPMIAPASVDPALAARGRELFVALRCAACHAGTDVDASTVAKAAPLSALDPARGCLAPAAGGDVGGAAPHYGLTDAQRVELRAAIAGTGDATFRDEDRLLVDLTSRNCLACHVRHPLGGVTDDCSEYFTSTDPPIGEDGRLPPPLTGVGGKLQAEWLTAAIAHGQRVRPYLRTRMPGFGDEFAARVSARLEAIDPVPEFPVTPLPKKRDAARDVRDVGRQLVGDKGMNCIACHAFAGEVAGAMAAVDLVESTGQRLRPEWFHAYLLEPARYRPGTLMPQFFVDGVSTRADIADGDQTKQVEAMWHYLAAGRNTRRPAGLRREPIALDVADEVVMLRRAVQNTGKRGISVGHPGGVNLTFDAESLAMNQVWWGRFLDVGPVLHGQGSGQARVPTRDHVVLGKGPAFATLSAGNDAWPAASRRDLGQRFLGYDLDAERRPTFRYTFGGITIDDAARGVPSGSADAPPALRRTLAFRADEATTLWFRAAVSPRIESRDPGVFRVGKVRNSRSLELTVPADREPTVAGTNEVRELRVRVDVAAGGAAPSELVVEYRWVEDK